jgi:ferredoxin/flavodoxin---NADP+ reductase
MALPADKFYRARITERKDFAADLWMIRVDPGAEFKFTAGQYATFGVEKPDRLVEKPYSIVSSPYEPQLEIFIELVPEGDLTPLLHKLRAGGELVMRKVAKGRFTLDTKSGHTHHLLLATVTGIAPFVSYVRTMARDWKEGKFKGEHKLFLLQSASRSWELGYREEMERFAAELPWFRYVPTISRPWEDSTWRGETGRVEDLIRKYSDMWECDPATTTGYICGHPEMIEHAKGILRRRGFAKESLREEVYWIPEKTDDVVI